MGPFCRRPAVLDMWRCLVAVTVCDITVISNTGLDMKNSNVSFPSSFPVRFMWALYFDCVFFSFSFFVFLI